MRFHRCGCMAVPGRDTAAGCSAVLAGQPVLRNRSSVRLRLADIRFDAAGLGRVQAICDFVHNHITFGYQYSRATRTAAEALDEGRGVCRDYTHLAVALCRCMNIPTRYCTGYLSDIGKPLPHPPGDFAAWMECYLSGRWQTFDPRQQHAPMIGRILIATGRDASDVPLTQTFGAAELTGFEVITEEIAA